MISKRKKARILTACAIFISTLFSLGLKALPAAVTEPETSEVSLPIIMYHSILKNPAAKTPYVISPDLFEEDLVYIKSHGYTPVFMKDVIAYVNDEGNLPDKPIVITFDDGYYNNLYYADPILKRHDMKAVLSVVGEMTEEFSYQPDRNPSYSHVTWDDILKMHLCGRWEMQNHSYSCHSYEERNGVSQMSDESYDEYEDFLMADLCHLQDKLAYVTGVTPNTFTYPFGAFTENTDMVLQKIGFKATLSCTEGVSTIKKGDPDCLYKLKRKLRPPDESSEEFFDFL